MIKYVLTTIAAILTIGVMAQQEDLFSNISQFGIGSSLIDGGKSITYDHNNDMIVYGTFSEDMDFDPGAGETILSPLGSPDLFLAKYQEDGTLEWAFNIGRISLDNGMTPGGLAVDADDNIYISGAFSNSVDFDPNGPGMVKTSAGGKDAFLAKYTADGDLIAVETYGSLFYEYADILNVSDNGDIYLALRFNGEIDLDPGAGEVILTPQTGAADAALVKYNSDGEYQWNYQISTENNDKITCVSVATSGLVAVGSTINGSTSGFSEKDMQLSMLASDGTPMWEYNFNNYEKGNAITAIYFTNENSQIFVGGRIEGNTDFNPAEDQESLITPLFADPFLAKYQVDDGALVWARYIRSGGTEDFLTGMTEAGATIVVAGSFDNTATFDPGDFTTQIASAGDGDIYMAAYDSQDGSYIGAQSFGGTGNETSVHSEFLPNGNMAMTGVFRNSLSLNPDESPITPVGYADVFFGEFAFQTNVSDNITETNSEEIISMYPVPAKNALNFDVNQNAFAGKVGIKIISVVGRVVLTRDYDSSSGTHIIDISELNRGVYIVEFDLNGKERFSKRLVKQ